jgi:hypothetical protein
MEEAAMKRVKKEFWILLGSALTLGAVWLATTPSVWRRFVPLSVSTFGTLIHTEMRFSRDSKRLQVMSIQGNGPNAPKTGVWQVFDAETGEELWHSRSGPQPGFGANVSRVGPAPPSKPRKDYQQDLFRSQASPGGRFEAYLLSQVRMVIRGAGDRRPYSISGPGYVLDTRTRRLSPPLGGTNIRSVYFTPDERQVALWATHRSSPYDQQAGTLSWWDWRSARRLKSKALAPTYLLMAAPKSRYAVRTERFDSGGNSTFSKAKRTLMEALDLRDGRSLWKYHSQAVIDDHQVRFSADGSLLVFPEGSGDWTDFHCVVLDGATGKALLRVKDSRFCALSPDGKYLATSPSVDFPARSRVFLRKLSHLRQ